MAQLASINTLNHLKIIFSHIYILFDRLFYI